MADGRGTFDSPWDDCEPEAVPYVPAYHKPSRYRGGGMRPSRPPEGRESARQRQQHTMTREEHDAQESRKESRRKA